MTDVNCTLDQINQEFRDIIKDIKFLSVNIKEPIDRVRTMQWIRKLCSQNNEDPSEASIRNEYAHFLRITMLTDPVYFVYPFKSGPPSESNLSPLCEILANNIASQHPQLPKTGPIRPVMCHKSSDGKAFITVNQCPEGGVYCYMAVCTEPMDDDRVCKEK